nr:hypothetical protein [Haliscomenobacter sp.]
MIGDKKEAWVLETAGAHWVAKKIEGSYAISNGLTLTNDYDLISPHVKILPARGAGAEKREDFSFAQAYSDWFYTPA